MTEPDWILFLWVSLVRACGEDSFWVIWALATYSSVVLGPPTSLIDPQLFAFGLLSFCFPASRFEKHGASFGRQEQSNIAGLDTEHLFSEYIQTPSISTRIGQWLDVKQVLVKTSIVKLPGEGRTHFLESSFHRTAGLGLEESNLQSLAIPCAPYTWCVEDSVHLFATTAAGRTAKSWKWKTQIKPRRNTSNWSIEV